MPARTQSSATLTAYRAVALILALIASLACARLNTLLPADPATDYYEAGIRAYDEGDYDQALADLNRALEGDANLAKAYYARGEVLFLKGQYDEAIADYGRAIEADYQPAAQAYSARGDANAALGDTTQSSQDYAQAYSLNTEFVSDYYPDRRRAYSRAIVLHVRLPSAHFARGWVNFLLEHTQQSINDFTAAIELKQQPLGPTYFARGTAYYVADDPQSAIADFSSVIELDPGSAEAYDSRAHAYVRLADYERALADLEQAVAADADFARAQNNYCWYGSLLGQAAEVMESCERGVALEPDNPSYRDSRGLARALTGDYPGAVDDFSFYLAALESRGIEDQTRAAWIAELEAGQNPFDEAALQALLNP
jgi:tetratricopeptide (TPR) repeat protein